MVSIFQNVPLYRNGGGPVDAKEALQDKLVLVYFSAHWCTPCRLYSADVKDFYERVVGEGGAVEVVFVSSDSSEDAFREYLKTDHGPWLYVPFHSEALEYLPERLGVTGIPAILLLTDNGSTAIPINKDEFKVYP